MKLYSYAVWLAYSKKKFDQMKRKSKPKQRCVSPLPTTTLSDVFKEAKSNSKRFSTPPPYRNKPHKNILGKTSTCNELNPLQKFRFVKGITKLRAKKETPWTRCLDNGGVKVTAVETTKSWIVNLSELYFGARFASGAHSRLYHGMYKNQPVAVKIIRLPDDDESGLMVARLQKQFTREATFLSHLRHPNVIKLAGACNKSPILFIITEYLSGGSLRTLLRKLDCSPLPLDNMISIALDVARGMEYIHSQGVIHRDLKSGNILFDANFCVKIADFGVACEEAHCAVFSDDAGTYRWMAPEMIKHKPYGRKVDVYSFGLLLWEMLTGAIPYEEMTPVQAAFAVVNKNLRPVIPADCPVVLRGLIERCWSTLPERRPEFAQIVKVLEQFKADLANGGTLKELQLLTSQDHKKRLLIWIEMLSFSKVGGFRPPTAKKL
ncbi:serine/threonine-protein kinase HT1-like [Phalaenopsis equestris]|uniref:serine/threonine-protein kinase HT1-like n=1 Tax=Phalaenopsis equestris TaxID=78828 RepID=UPI0009E49F6D|nr:serine/threonine-protein kinase HT1-like [Phalaenopsis equestris]